MEGKVHMSLRRTARVASSCAALLVAMSGCDAAGAFSASAQDAAAQSPRQRADAGSGGHAPGDPRTDGALNNEPHTFDVETLVEGLDHPWALAFLPDGDMLVTERPGKLSRIDGVSHERTPVTGLPAVAAVGQGGLLDIALHPSFEELPWVYLTYAASGPGGYATHVGRGRLEGNKLEDFEVLHVATPFLPGGAHFGSRVVFGSDGMLYVTVGDRGYRNRAQSLQDHQGTTLRLAPDGTIPPDNPFVGVPNAEPAIYSYGHRNAQGMVVHPHSKLLWQHEHGPRGGDEINLIVSGANYGWPVASYGREYHDDAPVGQDPHEVEGMVPPIHYWEDSFAPSGMTFYDGHAFPRWRGNLFMGSLVRRYLARLVVAGATVVSEEPLLEEHDWRIRDVRTGPDGYLYVLVDSPDAPLVRLVPAD
jgi:aldose sugar dehydrogenase